MGAVLLALEEGGPRNLELFWRGEWQDLQIELADQPVGSVSDPLQLEQGVEFTLPDGSVLHVQLVGEELRVLRDGVSLHENAADPVQRARAATYMLYGMAACATAIAMISFVIAKNPGKQASVTFFNVLFSGFVAVLGFFMFKRWRVAPVLAMAFLAIDTLVTARAMLMSPEGPGLAAIMWLIVRVLIFGALYNGFLGARELARREKQGPATSASLQVGTGTG